MYITSVDNASSNPETLINNQIKEIEDKIEYEAILDRKGAIKQAIEKSNIGDVIFISGRGNRAVFCKSSNEIDYFKDMDVVKEVLSNMKE